MRDNLHRFVINESCFPENVEQAIRNGFETADKTFLEECVGSSSLEDISGTCACICLFVEDTVYVANVGDSRSVMSLESGTTFEALSQDHKPNSRSEKTRILEAAGKIYRYARVTSRSPNQDVSLIFPNLFAEEYLVQGPWRILPGKLSVSRSFGDICAKDSRFGGNPQVLISLPDIRQVTLTHKMDFILIGCKFEVKR